MHTIGPILLNSENKHHLIPSVNSKGGKHHRSIIYGGANIIEDESGHQHQLGDLGDNDGKSSEVAAKVVPSTVQLLPGSHPEQEVQELADGHSKTEVRDVRLNFSSLYIRKEAMCIKDLHGSS